MGLIDICGWEVHHIFKQIDLQKAVFKGEIYEYESTDELEILHSYCLSKKVLLNINKTKTHQWV